MTKNKLIAIVLIGLAMCSFFISTTSAKEITVDLNGGADFTKIQDAINAADTGDVIIVKSGTYKEHIVIDKKITLKGEGYPIVDGEETGTVIWIVADRVYLEGFKVIRCDPARNKSKAGIKLSAKYIIINNSIISENNIGIDTGTNNVISNSTFKNNRIGLVIYNSERSTVKNNHFTNSSLVLDSAKKNLITSNIIELDPYFGISIYNKSKENIIVNNTIQLNEMGGFEIIESKWGPTSHNNKIYHNNIIDNGHKIYNNHIISEFQAYDDGNNHWDNGTEGNYWSDYKGKDANGDGIGDMPYDRIGDDYATNEKSGAKDNYPLMKPWSGTEEEIIPSSQEPTDGFKIGVSVMPWSDPIQPQSSGMSGRYSLKKGEYADLVKELKDNGVTRIFVSVYDTVEIDGAKKGVVFMKKSGNWNETAEEPIYPPENNNKPYFDLEKLLTEAHKLDMEVHASVDCFKLDKDGMVVGIDPIGASGLNQQIQIFSVVDYLLSNFKDDQNRGLDGIHLDYIRYVEPFDAKGDDLTMSLFLKNLDEQIIKDRAKLSAAVRAAKNEKEYNYMKNRVGQNYKTMSEHLDFISPMAYHYGEGGTDPSKPPDYKPPSYVGDVTQFVKSKVKSNCLVVPYIQGYYFYVKDGTEISVLEKPGFDEILNAGKSAQDNDAEGVNVFRYHHLSDDELNAIKALAKGVSETPEITKSPEKNGTPGFEAVFAIAGLLAVGYILRKRK